MFEILKDFALALLIAAYIVIVVSVWIGITNAEI
jgi:hypothetical protein